MRVLLVFGLDPAYEAGDAKHTAAAHLPSREGLNANRNLRRAAVLGFVDVIEVLDNSSWVSVARSGVAKDDTLQALLADRRQIRADFPDLCVYSVWQPRERGVIADAVSKLNLPYAGADIPNLPEERPFTGSDWAHAALLEAGFVSAAFSFPSPADAPDDMRRHPPAQEKLWRCPPLAGAPGAAGSGQELTVPQVGPGTPC